MLAGLLCCGRRGAGTDTTQVRVSTSAQEEVIKFLLDRGADLCATSKDQEWSLVKIARYHGVDSRIIRLLEERAKEKLETTRRDNVWDEKLHASRQADRKEAWCGCCFAVSTLPTQVLVPSQSLLRYRLHCLLKLA